jgi:hypothetical protein
MLSSHRLRFATKSTGGVGVVGVPKLRFASLFAKVGFSIDCCLGSHPMELPMEGLTSTSKFELIKMPSYSESETLMDSSREVGDKGGLFHL